VNGVNRFYRFSANNRVTPVPAVDMLMGERFLHVA